MIEKPPKNKSSFKTLQILRDYAKYSKEFSAIEKDYLYWDKAKYHVPAGLTAEEFWEAVKYSRRINCRIFEFPICIFFFKETHYMQELLHNFDMDFGGTIVSSGIISEKNRQYYLMSSIMEEAIASSQMEGAVTTRKKAKEMLRKHLKPKDKSQQMILNNYNTIRYLSEHKDDPLTPELLLEIHRQISEKTLDNPEDEGRFRTDDNIVVQNNISGEIAHTPPSYTLIATTVKQICYFMNNDIRFIHPIVKAIVLHFLISYLHPFVDGNGRTARSLFYWYMLKKGYWLTEFLSISRIIYKSKAQYEKAFLYSEYDDLDLGYFLHYNLKVLKKAFEELKLYLERKLEEENALIEYRNIPGINERQAQILKMCSKNPSAIFISKELESRFNVSVKTIRSDLEGLVKLGYMETVAINKRLKGYTRSKKI